MGVSGQANEILNALEFRIAEEIGDAAMKMKSKVCIQSVSGQLDLILASAVNQKPPIHFI